jgi:DNA-binding GntR family transcriptional regulator
MTRAADKFTMPRRYELISSVIRNNILNGRLPPGFVLLEGPIASLTQSSRAPVQAALRILEQERLVRRFPGRGYLVARDGEAVEPLRRDIRELDLQIPGEIDEALQNRGTWEMVYDTVEEAVASCLIFGEFRIIETELGAHLGVSRTVVRDVLSRLHESGLIRKNQSSHWIAGPLTAASVRNLFAIRAILEPAALRMAEPFIDYAEIDRALRSLETEGDDLEAEALDQVLMESCIARAPNPELVDAITRNSMPLIAANRALTRLGLPRDRIAMRDYASLFGLLAQKQIVPAAELLGSYLNMMAERSVARLKIVAIVSESSLIAPYLTPTQQN